MPQEVALAVGQRQASQIDAVLMEQIEGERARNDQNDIDMRADHCASPLSCRLPPTNHRQAVRHEWPILIHATSAAPLSSGSLHPSILKVSGVSCVASVGSKAGSRGSAGTIVVRATPATKSRLSIIIPPLLPIFR